MKGIGKVIGVCGACALLATGTFGGAMDFAWVKGSTDKDPLSYACGEKMVFTLELDDLEGAVPAGEFFLDWKRSGDDGLVETGRVAVTGAPFVYATKIDKPGFVRLQAYVVDKGGKRFEKKFTGDTTTPEGRKAMNRFEQRSRILFFDGGAGADVEKLEPHPEPKDFDAFWKEQYARLDKVPIKADLIELFECNPDTNNVRLYAVRVDCAGLRPVTGYLSVPKGADKGKTYAARLTTHGYSGDDCRHGAPARVKTDEIVFDINAHGLKLAAFGATEADRKALRWEIRSHDTSYALDPKQNADPETAYFNGMVLRVKRALQYLKTVKGWNKKDLIASGGSQGGLQTIWAAGCGEGVTRAESCITWCCDMYTNGKLRKDKSLHLAADGWYVGWTEAMGYYDAVNFAKRIPARCFTYITRAGLGDYCCPPTGLMKLWKAIPCNKKILWVQGSQHGNAPPKDYPTGKVWWEMGTSDKPSVPEFGRARPETPWFGCWSVPTALNPQPATFADTNLYAACDLKKPFDIGTTTNRPSQRVNSNRDYPQFSVTPVPCAMYTRAFVLCSDSGDKTKEPTFIVRITRYNDAGEWNSLGRAHEAMAEAKVDLRTAKKIKLPAANSQLSTLDSQLYLVEVPLDLGNIQDVVLTDRNGNFLKQFGRYLDVEFLGLTNPRVSPLGDRSMNTDPYHPSSITVYGARLEYPSAQFAMRWSEPGNIFHNGEKPVTFCDVTVNRPGKYTLGWKISDAEGKTVTTGTKSVGADVLGRPQTNVIDLITDLGWYALDWRLSDASGRTLMTHNAAFANLGKDTRTSGYGEGPYNIGSAYDWHYRIPANHHIDGFKLANKLGMRHLGDPPSGWMYKNGTPTLETRREWKLGKSFLCRLHNDYSAVMRGKMTEEQLAEKYRKMLKDDPNTTLCMIFWESYPEMGRPQAPELTGGKYDPAKAIPGASNRVELVKRASAFMRKNFPQADITVGNFLACTEQIAEFMRGGVPVENVDHMGLEVVNEHNLPERQCKNSIQSADYFRELAHIFGYDKWKPGANVENNYLTTKVVGADRQAWWYVRTQVLAQCWRFPLINIGILVDAGNAYTATTWGGSGLVQRWPYLYPKKAYVALATSTKAMDMVTDAKAIPTGDDCVYAVRFSRRDGKFAYGLWTSRAKADVRLTMNGAGWTACDIYGRPVGADVLGRPALTVGEAITWIVADKDVLAKVECLRQATPDDVPPKDFRVAVRCDDAAKWVLDTGKTPDVETELGRNVPCRVRAKNAAFKVVDDPEGGKCLELDLGAPDLTLPKAVREYMTLYLKEPVAIAGDAKSVGARVKGNSGWGRVYWILEGADGRRTVSTGFNEWNSDFDYNGRMTDCYGCWSFMRYPIAEETSITDYSTYIVYDLWSTGLVKYPAKLVGISFAAESRPLFLTERREKRQKIRIRDIGFFD